MDFLGCIISDPSFGVLCDSFEGKFYSTKNLSVYKRKSKCNNTGVKIYPFNICSLYVACDIPVYFISLPRLITFVPLYMCDYRHNVQGSKESLDKHFLWGYEGSLLVV